MVKQPSFRIRNWDCYVSQYIDTVLGKPFVLGETDCVSIVRGVLTAMYGQDMVSFRLNYTTQKTALKALKRHGIASELQKLGAVETNRLVRYAFCVVKNVDGFPQGVSIALANDTRLVTNPTNGVVRIPNSQATIPHMILRMPDV